LTPDERQALLEKHRRRWDETTPRCEYECFECGKVAYPCDVIKVLDATENLKFNDLKTKVECDHVTGSWILAGIDGDEKWLEFTYCPKCGVEL